MSSRYVPYARTPGRLLAQLTSDVVVLVWFAIWISVGVAVHSAIATIADVGRQVQTGADGVADSLSSAGHNADGIPLIGKAIGAPLRSASSAAVDIAGAGDSLNSTASWLAWVLALASRDTAGNAIWDLGLDDGAHTGSVLAGDTLFSATKVVSKEPVDARTGAVTLRVVGTKNVPPRTLLAKGAALFDADLPKTEGRVPEKVLEITRTLLVRRRG